ncbi:MAG TPA: DUF2269 family protein [Candidatus Eisenbacteria bacterium]|nr:DUF2269 family protein [Candidatus Eisenbacteria bacterium]
MPTGSMYLFLKLLHVFAVVLFLGNIIVGVFWKAIADKTRDPRVMAFAMDGIIRSDRFFTMPGVLLILIAGFGAAGVGKLPMIRTAWIFWSIVLFTISGIAFMGWLVPIQKKLRAVATAGAEDGSKMDWAAYGRLSAQWKMWGLVALITPLIALVLMVMKPV